MSRWINCSTLDVLDSIITGRKDVNQASDQGYYPFFSCDRDTNKFSNEYILDANAILIAGNGSYTGFVKKYSGKFDLYQRTYALYGFKPNVIWKYVYYLFKSQFEKKYMGGSHGAAIPYITKPIIINFRFDVPDLQTQKRIVSVLSAYDGLIENNEKRIKVLEELTQLLYTEWFTKFKFPGHEKVKIIESGTEYGMIPEGWGVKRLSEFAKEISRGPSLKYIKENGIPVVNQRCVRNGLIRWESVQYAQPLTGKGEKLYLSRYDVLVNSMGVGTLGRVSRNLNIHEKAIVHNCITLVRTNRPILESAIVYYFVKAKEKYLEALGAGATGQTSLKPEIIQRLEILIPDGKLLEKFSSIAMPMWDEIGLLLQNNDVLQKTRDLLIPQLVTGKRELRATA